MRKPSMNAEAAKIFAAMQAVTLRAAMAGDVKTAINGTNMSQEEKHILHVVNAAGKQHNLESTAAAISAQIGRGALQFPGLPATPEESGLASAQFKPDESQQAAIAKLAGVQYGALIGAAGTGKTTIIKRLIASLIYGTDGTEAMGLRNLTGKQGPSIAIVTFTGTASSVVKAAMPAWAAPMCKTIHTLLEYAPVNEGSNMFEPKRNLGNKLDHDVIFVDEAGQLGTNLWHNFVDALRPWTRIYLIGDINQLPPIADSPFFPRVLANALSDDPKWTLCELTKVHRQSGAGGNKVLEAAHAILAGKQPTFDMTEENPAPAGTPWFVAGIMLPNKTEDAHAKIIKYMNGFRKVKTIGEAGDTESRNIYMPYDDLLLTAGNGYDHNSKGAAVQQVALNDVISSLIISDTNANGTHVIDAGRVSREFAVGDRVMCTRNEDHNTVNRVTNGTLGVVTEIEWNPEWHGDRMKYGNREEVLNFQRAKVLTMMGKSESSAQVNENFDLALESLATMDLSNIDPEKVDKQASHIITVSFKNGAVRRYKTALGVENLVLAYATTTAKAQGGQADTVFIVCHSSVSFQLNREWLYTGVTRAQRRIVIFYTDLGLRTALAKQQIYGATLLDKIKRYAEVTNASNRLVRLIPEG